MIQNSIKVINLKKDSLISRFVSNNKKTLAVRFPKNKLTQKLLKSLNYPLAAPSANISTKISPVSKDDVKEEFGNKIKFILDGGRSKIGLESTIISLVDKPKILRLGGMERTKINKVLNKSIKYDRLDKKITVPGQLKLHYSPGIPIKLNTTKSKNSYTWSIKITLFSRNSYKTKYY